MKVIAYLTEPASYTIDLVKNVHLKNNIDFIFLFDKSYTKQLNDLSDNFIFLNKLSLISRFKLLKINYIKYEAIIFNGYDTISFLILLFIHFFLKLKNQ